MKQSTLLLALVIFIQLSFGQFIGGLDGPCSAVTIPGPFETPVNVFGNTGVPNVSNVSNSLCTTSNSPAIWYSIQPQNQNQITVSTCAADTNYDTIISVYSGSCSFLSCVTYNDDDTVCVHPRTSAVTFSPVAYEIYYISVGGYGAATGIFQLFISEAGTTTAGSSCTVAVPLTIPIYDYYDSNSYGTGYSSSCTYSDLKYVWYTVPNVIAGVPINITTCSSETDLDTVIAVFNSCSNTTCAAFNDDSTCLYESYASSISYTPYSSSPIFIAVGGYGGSVGDFGLFIQQSNGVSYTQECLQAEPFVYGTSTFGYTFVSEPIQSPPCYNIGGMKTSWYYFTAPYTTTVVASTCNYFTNFYTAIYVYYGSCSSLYCSITNPTNYCFDDAFVASRYHKNFEFLESVSPSASASPSHTITPSSSATTSSTPSRTPTQTPTPTPSSTTTPTRSSTPSSLPSISNNYGNAVRFSATANTNYYVVVTGRTTFDTGSFLLYLGTY